MTENEETPQVPEASQIPEAQMPEAEIPLGQFRETDMSEIRPPIGDPSGVVQDAPADDSSAPPEIPSAVPVSHPTSEPFPSGRPGPQAPVAPYSPWAPNQSASPWQSHAQAPNGDPLSGQSAVYGSPAQHQLRSQWPGSEHAHSAPGSGGHGHFGQPPSWPPQPAPGPSGMGQWPGTPAQRPPHRVRGLLVSAVVLLVAVTGMLGALVGHAVWQSTTTSSTGLQSTGAPFKTSNGGSSSSSTSPKGTSAAAIASSVDPGLVDVNTTLGYQSIAGAGTGMVLTSNGLVLTNNHVIEGETSISVTDIGNHRTYAATVVGYDRSKDIALIQLTNASGLTTVTLSSSAATVGNHVVAIGNAGGTGGNPSYAAGTITNTNQSITASDSATGSSEQLTGLIETDANIVPGDSGGPLVNSSGDVVAMDTAAAQGFAFQSQASQGYGIPIATAEGIARSIENGTASTTVHIGATAFLGVQVESPSAVGSGTPGALIAQVEPNDPAANANLTVGDTITSLGGTAVASPEALTVVMLTQKPGSSVHVDYVNASGTQGSTTVVLGSGPPQ